MLLLLFSSVYNTNGQFIIVYNSKRMSIYYQCEELFTQPILIILLVDFCLENVDCPWFSPVFFYKN